ncbi:MAG TPA: hypothetical protein VF889_06840, partial [Bacteroidota bacterium]
VVSFVLDFYREGSGLDPAAAAVLPWMVVALSLLMVSKVKYDTLPKPSRKALRKSPWKFALLVLAAAAAAATAGAAIFPLFALFIAFGVVRHLIAGVRRFSARPRDKFDDEVVEPTRVEP